MRHAHPSPGAPDVDVYVDGEPVGALAGVPFGAVPSYLPLPASSHSVEVYATGDTSESLVEADVDLRGDAAYTV